MFRVLRLRLYSTRNQETILTNQLESCRILYNAAVEHRQLALRRGIRFSRFDQQDQLPEIRRAMPELAAMSSIVLQDVMQRVHRSFDRHRQGITGPPRFRRRGRYVSMSYSAHKPGNYFWNGNRISFGKIGPIKCRMSGRPPWFARAAPKGCTIKRRGARWWAYVRFEVDMVPPREVRREVLGLDLGLESFAVSSQGEFFKNPHSYSRRERKIQRLQRRYDRRQLGGRNREKAQHRVAREFEKASEERLDFHHKLARYLALRAPFIAVESHITGLRRGMLRKQIYDAGWGQFLRILAYKLEAEGGRLVPVSRDNTSRRCSRCRTLVPKILKERTHRCPTCGLTAHRDVNAAINLQHLGIAHLPREPGKVTPAETGSYRPSGPVPVGEAGTSVH